MNREEIANKLETIIDDIDKHNLHAERHNKRGMTFVPYRNLSIKLAQEVERMLEDAREEGYRNGQNEAEEN